MIRARLLLVAALAALAQPALAQPAATDEARARALYDEGDRLYNLADYDLAIARFKEAFKLLPEPLFLYNIAQAYRQKGDCGSARTFYRNYLRAAPAAPNRAKVEQRIAEMEACLAAPRTDVPEPTRPTEPTATLPTATQPATPMTTEPATPVTTEPVTPVAIETGARPPAHRGRVLRIAGLGTGAAGVVLVGAGVFFARSASGHADDLEGLCRTGCDADDPDVRDADDAGDRASRNAVITLSLGGAALVAGAAMYAWGWHTGRERPVVSLGPTRGGAVVGAAWAF